VKSIAEQDVEQLGGAWSVLVRQRNDHERLEGLLQRIRVSAGEDQQELLNRVSRLVFSHAFAEEAVLWPALRRAVPDGDAVTEQVEREHQDITELVAELDRTPLHGPGREPLIEQVVALLRKDVRDEEDELLPRLQDALDASELRRLGVVWEAVRRTAPTRAHPIVSRRPPGNVLAALPLSAIDRLRDAVDRAGRRATPGTRRRLQAAGRGLAAVARSVEHLPPMRRGEPASTHAGGRGEA
jgi:hemerythrin superfamily protein